MKTLKKLTFEEFQERYKGWTHISCGIHFTDGDFVGIQNVSFPYAEYTIKTYGKEVAYIAVF